MLIVEVWPLSQLWSQHKNQKMKGINKGGGKISHFYSGKSILITGSTGFMGKVLVHKLLSDCQEIDRIYLLIRPKKGIIPVDRLNVILETPIFHDWKVKKPEQVAKLIPITGDILEPSLGLSKEDVKTVTENVSIVFHSAATVRFDEPIERAVQMNLHGTVSMIELAKKMSKLEVFVHVSTAYAHCYMKTIEEKFYIEENNLHSQDEFWKRILSKDESLKIDDGKFPNPYTCSKALTESYLSQKCQNIPLVIIRPSIVVGAWQEPVPGWIDNFNGPTGLMAAGLSGLLRTILVDREKVADFVPVDVVINVMIVAAWKHGTKKGLIHIDDPVVPIYNCTSGATNPITWGQILDKGLIAARKNPVETIFWYPALGFKSWAFHDFICRVMFHYVPALLADFVLTLFRKKRFMMKISKKLTSGIGVLKHFTSNEWVWKNQNMLKLQSELEQTDNSSLQAFDFDMRSLDWQLFLENYLLGIRHFLLKNKPETLDSSRRRLKLMKFLHYIVQCFFVIFIYYITRCFI